MDGTSRIDELEQKFIENPRRYFAPLANEYRKAGNPHQAIAICRAHLGQLPGHMSGQIVYGQSLFEAGEFAEARTVFENALAMDRENLVALRHLGDLSVRDADGAQARQWYSRLLEVDPKDSAVISLVSEIDAAAGNLRSREAASSEPAAQGASGSGEASSSPGEVPVEQPVFHSDEEDQMISEEIGYPMPPPQAFVTETMAELYLSQGFRDRALNVYRQLAWMRPDDERVRSRLAELQATAMEPVEARREEPPSVESPDEAPDGDRSTSVESPAKPTTVRVPSEESPDGGGEPIDSPPSVEPPSEGKSVESPERDVPRAEPEGNAVRELTVREFFATLGRRRPGSRVRNAGGNGNGVEGRDFLFAGDAADDDRRAAANLAGAFPGPQSFAGAGAEAQPAPGGPAPGKESEEDVARFRAWLDGLTGE